MSKNKSKKLNGVSVTPNVSAVKAGLKRAHLNVINIMEDAIVYGVVDYDYLMSQHERSRLCIQ